MAPYGGRRPHRPRGRVPFNKKSRKKFLNLLAQGWSESYSCRQIPISWQRYKTYKKETPAWQAKIEEAIELGTKELEDQVTRRGSKGVLEPIVSAGKIVTYKRVYSDSLLKLAVTARSPTYASFKPTGPDTELALAGAAETLLSRLTNLFEFAAKADKAAAGEEG